MDFSVDDQIRFTTHLALVRRGMSPDDPAGAALGHALHPFDTHGPVPPRALEKQVRRRSLELARSSRDLAVSEIMPATLQALQDYATAARRGAAQQRWPVAWAEQFEGMFSFYEGKALEHRVRTSRDRPPAPSVGPSGTSAPGDAESDAEPVLPSAPQAPVTAAGVGSLGEATRRAGQAEAAGVGKTTAAATGPVESSTEVAARTKPRSRIVTAALLLGIVTIGLVSDQAWRAWEVAELTRTVEQSERAMLSFMEEASALVEEEASYGEDGPPEAIAEQLTYEFEEVTGRAIIQLEDYRANVRAMPIALWHGEVELARRQYSRHVTAWRDRLQWELGRKDEVEAGAIGATWFLFKDAYLAAEPSLPWPGGLRERMQRVVEQGDPSSLDDTKSPST